MSKLWLIVLAVVVLVAAGCASPPSGDREYTPGKGWQPVPNN